jgi:hypothetical protein
MVSGATCGAQFWTRYSKSSIALPNQKESYRNTNISIYLSQQEKENNHENI